MEKLCRADYFTMEEQTIIIHKYEEFKHIIQAKSNTVATLMQQQKPGRNAGRKLPTLLMCKFTRSYNINISDNINGQHSDHTMPLYYGTDVWGRALPQCPSFHSDIKLV